MYSWCHFTTTLFFKFAEKRHRLIWYFQILYIDVLLILYIEAVNIEQFDQKQLCAGTLRWKPFHESKLVDLLKATNVNVFYTSVEIEEKNQQEDLNNSIEAQKMSAAWGTRPPSFSSWRTSSLTRSTNWWRLRWSIRRSPGMQTERILSFTIWGLLIYIFKFKRR